MRRVTVTFAAPGAEAVLALNHPNVEVVVLRSAIEEPCLGHEGIRRAAEAFDTADLQLNIDEVRDCGDDRVLVLGQQHSVIEGVPFDRGIYVVFQIEARKVRRCQAFSTKDEALEAAGLRE